MLYQDAKAVLQRPPRRIPGRAMAVEAMLLVAVAASLVMVF
jgi:hypothetical protein